MDNVNVPELVRNLGSEDDSTRKMAAFRLQTAIGDPSFADVFIYQGGLPKLKHLTLSATGNTLAYSLASFTNLLELDIGWDWIGPELVDRVREMATCLHFRNEQLMFLVLARPTCRWSPACQYLTRRHVHPGCCRLPSSAQHQRLNALWL